MDKAKVTAVTKWPTPQTIKYLEHFLSCANSYQWSILGFSSTATPLTAILKKGQQNYPGTPLQRKLLTGLRLPLPLHQYYDIQTLPCHLRHLNQGWELCNPSASVNGPNSTLWLFFSPRSSLPWSRIMTSAFRRCCQLSLRWRNDNNV